MRINGAEAILTSSAVITTGLITSSITHVALRALKFPPVEIVILSAFCWGFLHGFSLLDYLCISFQNDSVQTARIKFFAIGTAVGGVAMRFIGRNAQWGYKGKVAEGAIALANGLLYTSLMRQWAEEIHRDSTMERKLELIRDLGKADAVRFVDTWKQFDEFGKRSDVSNEDITSLFDDWGLNYLTFYFPSFALSETTFLKLSESNNFTLEKLSALLNLAKNNPQRQIQLLQKHPFGSCSLSSDFDCSLHEETIDYVLQNSPTIQDLLFICSKRDVTKYLLDIEANDFIEMTRHIRRKDNFLITSVIKLFACLPEPTVTSIMEELVKTQSDWHEELLESIVLSKSETTILDLPNWYQNHVKFLSQEYLEKLAFEFRKHTIIPLLDITVSALTEENVLKLMHLYYSYVIKGRSQAKDEQKIAKRVREIIATTPYFYLNDNILLHVDDTKYVLDMLDAFVCREDVTAANIRNWFNVWTYQYNFWNLPTLNTDALSPAAIAKLLAALPESFHLLHLMQNHPQTQIDMMHNNSLNIIHQSNMPIRYWYPKLHPDAINDLLRKPDITPIEIGICATQDENARKQLAECSSLAVTALFPRCEGGIPDNCWDHVHCWNHSITKLAFDEFSNDMKKDLLSFLIASPWFPFALESALQLKLVISDDILFDWANKNITNAFIVAKHRPDLLGRINEALQPRVTQIQAAIKPPSDVVKTMQECKEDILFPYTHLVKELFTDDPNYFKNRENFSSITDVMQTVRTMLTPEGWYYEPIPGKTTGSNIFDLLTKDVITLICWRLSIRDRIRLARTCTTLYNRVCGHEGTAIWKKHGSIGALKRLHEIKDAARNLAENDTHINELTCKLLQLSWPGH